jgi:hypothetical protein
MAEKRACSAASRCFASDFCRRPYASAPSFMKLWWLPLGAFLLLLSYLSLFPLLALSPFSLFLEHGLGLLSTDEELWIDARTRPFVQLYAVNATKFFDDFDRAMEHHDAGERGVGRSLLIKTSPIPFGLTTTNDSVLFLDDSVICFCDLMIQ